MSATVVFRSLDEAKERSRPCALAIGNFDGVHLGHQSLLRGTVALAQKEQVIPAALTFDPHPTTVVAPERVPLKLCSLNERLRLLAEAGAQQITVLPFTPGIARLSPEAFVREIVLDTLKARLVLVGENFRFGFQQAGDAATLSHLGEELGFDACLLAPVLLRGEIVSSSAIRRYLSRNMVGRANRLLGHCFAVEGEIVSGFGIGSRQTVPTLNLQPVPGELTPRGVFITKTFDQESGRHWQSITNVGNRPTFNGQAVTIETFLLSPFEEPAPNRIRVEFHRFVREERSFSNGEMLRAQIMLDVGCATKYWRRMASRSKAAPSIY